MDAVLQVVSPEGFVLAQNDDDVGPDPRIVFEAPSPGAYIVRLFAFPAKPDSSIRFAGGTEYVYRLTVTTGGFIDYAFPLAVGRDGPASVEALGWNIPAAARAVPVPCSDGREVFTVAVGSLSGHAEVRRVPDPATVEAEPDDGARPQEIAGSVAVSGRIDPPGDQDAYRLSLKKGDKRVIRVESRPPWAGRSIRRSASSTPRARSSPIGTIPAAMIGISKKRSRPRRMASTTSSCATSTTAAVLDSPTCSACWSPGRTSPSRWTPIASS